MEQLLAELLHRFTYLAMVLLLSAAGLGIPISEDLVLLIGGALSARGVTLYWPTLCAGYFGVILGDLLIHHWGARMGPKAYDHKLVRKVFSVEREERLRVHFARHGFWTVVVGRHTPGLRAPIFFLSGASGVGFWKFLAADCLSAAITVPIVVTLGFLFGEHLDDIRRTLHEVNWMIAGAALLGVGVWWFLRKRRQRREAAGREPTVRSRPRRDVRESSGPTPV